MRFGIYIVPNHPWSELERRWGLAEELGFDSVWDCDDLYWSDTRGGICFDGLVVLAAMAAQTRRVRVGTLMLSLPIRDNPAVLAKEIIALDHLSNGRLEFGFGAGILEKDHSGAGHEFWAKEERIARFREAVEIVERALREEVVTFAGRYYHGRLIEERPDGFRLRSASATSQFVDRGGSGPDRRQRLHWQRLGWVQVQRDSTSIAL